MSELKCVLLNAENLFIYLDQTPLDVDLLSEDQWQKLSTSQVDLKPLRKLKALGKLLLAQAPDVIMLCEVGGLESLENFNKYFLKAEYFCCLVEGNSDRGIDIGYLVKKNLPFRFEFFSNRHREIGYLYPHERQTVETGMPETMKVPASHKFSRDVVELKLHSATNPSNDKPSIIFLLVHLKSPLDPEKIDPRGTERREAELRTLVQIYNEIEADVGPTVPIVVAGDFNGNASRQHTEPEFKYLYENSNLEDVLQVAQIPEDNRATFFLVRNSGKSDGRQIDYCFLSPAASQLLDHRCVGICPYKDEWGMDVRKPLTLDEKTNLPSDHYPIFFSLKNLPIR